MLLLIIAPISAYDPWKQATGESFPTLGDVVGRPIPDSESTVFPYHSPELNFINKCSQPVKLILAFKRGNKWEKLSYENLGGSDSTHLADQNNRRIILSDPTVYYYAETTGRASPQVFWYDRDDRNKIDFQGKYWSMIKQTLSMENGDYVLRINCDNTAFFIPDNPRPEAGVIDIAPPIWDSSKQPPPPT